MTASTVRDCSQVGQVQVDFDFDFVVHMDIVNCFLVIHIHLDSDYIQADLVDIVDTGCMALQGTVWALLVGMMALRTVRMDTVTCTMLLDVLSFCFNYNILFEFDLTFRFL